jgi:hypothetical protein
MVFLTFGEKAFFSFLLAAGRKDKDQYASATTMSDDFDNTHTIDFQGWVDLHRGQLQACSIPGVSALFIHE